jgi:hypothetical protein
MRKKSTNYSGADSGGWMNKCDDLFLAQFRGRPCAICGQKSGVYKQRTIRSMGHHLLSKELHRAYRYTTENIITLCANHHLGAEMSPHSHDTAAQVEFYDWLRMWWSSKHEFILDNRHDKFNKEWCYRDMYELLGGEINKTGPKKNWEPVNHAKAIRKAEGLIDE